MNMTIATQRFDERVPEVMLSTVEGHQLLGNGWLDTFPQQRINTITEELLGVVTYSVLSEVIKGGYVRTHSFV
jgi:hypothetical protein